MDHILWYTEINVEQNFETFSNRLEFTTVTSISTQIENSQDINLLWPGVVEWTFFFYRNGSLNSNA